MNSNRINGFSKWLVLAVLSATLGPVAADVVPSGSYAPHSKGPSGSFAPPPSTWTNFTVSLDLSGYSNAAVTFDFASLIAKKESGFSASPAPEGVVYQDGFLLLSPVHSLLIPTGPNSFSHGSQPNGFQRGSSDGRFATAMFNLAAYDGQTVLLHVAFNGPAAARTGLISLDNVAITVSSPAAATVAALTVPEPTSIALVLIAFVGLVGARIGRPFGTRAPATPRHAS